ncbi:MAG TPA: putative Ig domain-containing protein [Acetobacteraceae bacterium]|jgi:hypothetical protein
MAVTLNKSAFVDQTAESIGLSQMFTVTPAATDPLYLVLTVLDRNEYTAGASGATGTLTGNGHTLSLANIGGDGRGAGIVFTYQASTGRYFNSTYGYLDQLTYNSSGSLDDLANLSLFGAGSFILANEYASNAVSMMQVDPSGYLGSVTVATEPKFTTTAPSQATPDSIASVADSFVGQAWNMDGCWVLASTISAEAGASLPVQSTLIGLPGQANGEWIVAYDGPAGQSGNWQSMVTEGEMIVIGTPGGGGHITTCVSGSGASAMLVDNITYVNGSGQVQNSANDGSSSDVIIAAPHAASQEWSGVAASSVVIYELDTPIVTDKVAADSLALLASQSLASLFSVTDPGNRTITSYQIYDTSAADSLTAGGTSYSDHSAASALTDGSLSAVSLVAGSAATTDTLELRAFNGLFWGDWESLAVTVAGAQPSPPVLVAQTASQTWDSGAAKSLALPAGTFRDPQNEALTYAATLSNGQALPSWLTFNAATDTFSGTPPATAEALAIKVTATDTSLLSVSDTFSVTVVAPPSVTDQTASQTWTEGKAVSLTLPANTFTDPQGQKLTYTAAQANGQALPSWLTFNAATETFSGTAPTTAQSLSLKVTATDASGLSASDTFAAAVQAPAPGPAPAPPTPFFGIAVTQPTPNQVWTDNQAVAVILPTNTFTDSLGLKMTFAAYEVSGPNITSWLHFNPANDELFGTVPAAQSGTIGIAIIATDSLHMTAADMFTVTFESATSHVAAGVAGSMSLAETFNPSQMGAFMGLQT